MFDLFKSLGMPHLIISFVVLVALFGTKRLWWPGKKS